MLKTLLVDDSLSFRSALHEALQVRFPFSQIAAVASVQAALDHAANLRPHLVITDLMLPDGTGLELIRRLRGMRVGGAIVLITIHDFPEYREEAVRSGADKFFAKLTLSLQELLEYVDGVVDGRLRMLAVCGAPVLGRALETLFAAQWPDMIAVHTSGLEEGLRTGQGLRPHLVLFHAGDDAGREAVFCRALRAPCPDGARYVCVRQRRVDAPAPAGTDFVLVAGPTFEDEVAGIVQLALAESFPHTLLA